MICRILTIRNHKKKIFCDIINLKFDKTQLVINKNNFNISNL